MDIKKEDQKEYVETSEGRGYTRIYISTSRTFINNFIGGLAWGFGVILGATVVVTLVLWVLNQLGEVPIIGELVSKIIEDVQNNQIIR